MSYNCFTSQFIDIFTLRRPFMYNCMIDAQSCISNKLRIYEYITMSHHWL